MYIVDLAGGIGSGVSIAGRESLLAAGWMDGQSEASDAIIPTFTGVLEGFSPFAYAITAFRQRNNNEPSTTLPSDFYFRLLGVFGVLYLLGLVLGPILKKILPQF